MSIRYNLVFAVTVALLDSAFSHGYQLFCLRNLSEPVEEWLISKDYMEKKLKNNTNLGLNNTPVDFKINFFMLLECSFSIGGAVGSCLIVTFANKFGRKGGMLMTTFISFFASLFTGYSKYFDRPFLLLIGRTLFGIKSGVNCGLGPMYLFEISPQEIRGKISMLYGVFVSVGTVVGSFAGINSGNRPYWPLVISLTVIPAVLQLVFFPSCPESPKYLRVVKNNELECRKALKWLRGKRYKEEELDKLRIEYRQRQILGEISLGFIINNSLLRTALIMSTVLIISQQLCGVSLLLLTAKRYAVGNVSKNVSNMFNVTKAMSVILFFFVIEKRSRKEYYLVSFSGMAIVSFLIYIVFFIPNFGFRDVFIYSLLSVYLLFYKFGTGSMAWFAASEYFNTSAAPIAYSIGFIGDWLIKAFLICFAEPLIERLKGYSFLNYTATNFAFAYFAYSRVIDTRNKSIKEVYRSIYWNRKKND